MNTRREPRKTLVPSNKRASSLPRMSMPTMKYNEEAKNLETLNSDSSEARKIARVDFQNRNKTVRSFFKNYDLDIVDSEGRKYLQEAKKKVTKESTLTEIEKNKENRVKQMKKKMLDGKLFVKEFWSKDYYKKIMKYTKLNTIINFIQKEKWKSLLAKDTMKKGNRQYLFIPNNLFVQSFSKIFKQKNKTDYEIEDTTLYTK